MALALLEPSPERNWAKREDLLRQAVAANPDWAHANGFLGDALAQTGRVQEALTYLDKATVEDRPGQNWEGGAAIELAAAGDVSRADADYTEMLKYWADSPDDWYPRLLVRLFEGRWDDAAAVLKEPVAASVLAPADVSRLEASLDAFRTHAPATVQQVRQAALADAARGGNLPNAIYTLVLIGDLDDAFAVAQHYEPGQSLTMTGPGFLFYGQMAPMRRDPRFMQLADRLGLLAFYEARRAAGPRLLHAGTRPAVSLQLATCPRVVISPPARTARSRCRTGLRRRICRPPGPSRRSHCERERRPP